MSDCPNGVSIILCTRDRAEDLRLTLAALARVCVPDGLAAELLVVDNASADHTAEVVRACRLPNMPVRCVHEPRRGKGHAYNTGMAQARGDVLLFTDDDVRPPRDWIGGMCRPILAGQADVVAGTVRLAPHLERPWMEPMHRAVLASTELNDKVDPVDMVGASMAFARKVRERVPGFDVELGPGALGFWDDTLYAHQLREAGYRLMFVTDAEVEHDPGEGRLSRASYLQIAEKFGRCYAYVTYHWRHEPVEAPRRRLLKRRLRLALWRLSRGRECAGPEGIPMWEFHVLADIAFYAQYLKECRRPRNYDKCGLVKRRGLGADAPAVAESGPRAS